MAETALVLGIRPGEIKIGAVGMEEIVQNIRIIVNTRKGSVPLDRNFGIDMSFIDKPLPLAKAMASAAIFEGLQQYEPRVEVTIIDWRETEADAMIGRLAPVVGIRLSE